MFGITNGSKNTEIRYLMLIRQRCLNYHLNDAIKPFGIANIY